MISTTYTCDRCKHTQSIASMQKAVDPNSRSMYQVKIMSRPVSMAAAPPYQGYTDTSFGGGLLCHVCLNELQITALPEKDKPILSFGEKLEMLVQELVDDSVANAIANR